MLPPIYCDRVWAPPVCRCYRRVRNVLQVFGAAQFPLMRRDVRRREPSVSKLVSFATLTGDPENRRLQRCKSQLQIGYRKQAPIGQSLMPGAWRNSVAKVDSRHVAEVLSWTGLHDSCRTALPTSNRANSRDTGLWDVWNCAPLHLDGLRPYHRNAPRCTRLQHGKC